MAAAQVAKKLKDKRQKKTIEGIFNKVLLNLKFFIFPELHNVKMFSQAIFQFTNVCARNCVNCDKVKRHIKGDYRIRVAFCSFLITQLKLCSKI